ncbi:MAG: GyrI-like domain-containing protein [Bacteroidia bacterium]|nr:GyrI-like domain-containing protein [Bacteroidia bacterium]
MEKIDFKKTLKHLYQASDKKISIIEVPKMQYLMVKGKGSPEDKGYHEAIEALYSAAFTLKFMLKDKKLQPKGYFDFVIPPLESLWSMEEGCFDPSRPDDWIWTAMIIQPDYIHDKLLTTAKKEAMKKKDLPAMSKLILSDLNEGKALQMLHIGPYNEVSDTYSIIIKELQEKGLKVSGQSHEIYLSDPRRVAPEKLRTIVRMAY